MFKLYQGIHSTMVSDIKLITHWTQLNCLNISKTMCTLTWWPVSVPDQMRIPGILLVVLLEMYKWVC